ncbi:PREDICTED: adenylate isopentenyltransferase 5, chloroplastic-like [Ipomoea nil]|uniref:adenylate isopentenyltransferase 5, chloroplastic-like n=1 Tax=Ipomoea nil TaxID=35883 RepID=UPI000901E167|nr:PREDICTED: adenylate isopentenyltransferase 5, chloroplastic-like [Ipomoea nil]
MAMNTVNKKVVAFVMGATGSGKSKLSVALAARIGGEIINSDKIQVYEGLDVLGNRIPEEEKLGVPHHLLGHVKNPDEEYTARDFCFEATSVIERIINSGKVPIVGGGSNSFIEALVEDPDFEFMSKYVGCFIWLDVSPNVLNTFVSKRVDQMVNQGLVDEVRGIFAPDKDYTKGIRRAIGVPEMDKYMRAETNKDMTVAEKKALLESAIAEIKTNTIGLIRDQVGKIQRLRDELGWPIHRIDPTAVFQIEGDKQAQEAAWLKMVFNPSFNILQQYLKNI